MRDRDFWLRPARRREAIRTLVGAGLGGIVLVSAPARGMARRFLGVGDAWAQACTLTPELTEGPYYLDGAGLRRNVIENRPGVILFLSLTVVDATSCAPLPGATVEIWHADASGDYSGFDGQENQTFLRGRQIAGANGAATFRTIYPGWYPGRTPHIHVKVLRDGSELHTGQVFFDEAVTSAVYAREPYRARGAQDTSNAADGIFRAAGAASTLTLAARGAGFWGKTTLVVAA